MANLLFKRGSYNDFKTKVLGGKAVDGALYLTEDEGSLYVGKSDGSVLRVQGTVHQYADLKEFGASVTPPYSTDVIYFIANKNALIRWNGSTWVQLNTTADAAAAEIARLEGRIATNENSISGLNTAVGKNTSDIASHAGLLSGLRTDVDAKATQAAHDALAGKVTTAEGKITANEKAIETKADKTTVENLTTAVGNNTTNISNLTTNLNNLTETVATKATKTEHDELAGRVTQNEKDIATKAAQGDLNSAVGRIESLETNAGTVATQIQGINTALDTKAAQADLTALADKVTTAEGEIDDLQANIVLKAAQADLEELSETVSGHTTALGTHGTTLEAHGKSITKNAGDIATINTTLANKADKSTVETLTGTVNGLSSSKADKTVVENLTTRVDAHDTAIAGKVDKVTGKGLSTNDYTTAEKTKLAGIAENATRVLVDDALNKNSTNAIQNKVVATKFETVEGNVSANATAIANIPATYVNKDDHAADIKELADDIAEINQALGGDADGSSVNDRLTALESTTSGHTTTLADHGTRVGALETTVANLGGRMGTAETDIDNLEKELNTASTGLKARMTAAEGRLDGLDTKTNNTNSAVEALTGRVGTNETNIANLQTAVAQRATKAEVEALETALKAEIDADIMAANAMTYKGGVDGSNKKLPTSNVSVGDTYVVTAAFGNYQPGDFLIAQGDETNGVITGTITWDHVATGYSDMHDPKLEVANNAIMLKDFGGEALGTVVIKAASENVVVATSGNEISIDLQWGSF